MPTMNMGSSIASGSAELTRVRYYPPLLATLLGALFIFTLTAVLGLLMVGNTLSQWENAGAGQSGGSVWGAGCCGLLSLLFFVGAVYFLYASIKGVRDLGSRVHYTRGVVAEQRSGVRRSKHWLLVEPAYLGTDLAQATILSDEQIAASADRTEIFQPRSRGGFMGAGRKPHPTSIPGLEPPKSGGYLSQERISANAKPDPESSKLDKGDIGNALNASKSHVFFRTDFASHAKLQLGEEVLVAHSLHLQHPYYVARLVNGEWQVYRNKALI